MVLTNIQQKALIRLHGSPRTLKAAKIDKRTAISLHGKGLVRLAGGNLWSLTPAGVEEYNNLPVDVLA